MQNLMSALADRVPLQAIQHGPAGLWETVDSLLVPLAEADPMTFEHSIGVAAFAAHCAGRMDWEARKVGQSVAAGLLHDVGKIAVPHRILYKPAKLTAAEWDELRQHPVHGDDLLAGVSLDADVRLAAAFHHERLDGSGYPFGVKGADLSPLARLIAIADIVDAMAADRPYRPGLSVSEIREALAAQRDRGLDPGIVDLAVDCLETGYVDPRWSAIHLSIPRPVSEVLAPSSLDI